MPVFKFKGRSPLFSKYIQGLLSMPEVSVLSEEAGAALILLPSHFTPVLRERGEIGKAAFVHPECISVSILVWIRRMSLLSHLLCFDSHCRAVLE